MEFSIVLHSNKQSHTHAHSTHIDVRTCACEEIFGFVWFFGAKIRYWQHKLMLMKSTAAINYITITKNCVIARYESHSHKLLTDNSQYHVNNNIALQYNMPTLRHSRTRLMQKFTLKMPHTPQRLNFMSQFGLIFVQQCTQVSFTLKFLSK